MSKKRYKITKYITCLVHEYNHQKAVVYVGFNINDNAIYIFTYFFSVCKFHLKKLEGRRLDFDYKKNSKRRIAEAELKQALDKFEESKELAKRSMFNLLENDVRKLEKSKTLKRIFFFFFFLHKSGVKYALVIINLP